MPNYEYDKKSGALLVNQDRGERKTAKMYKEVVALKKEISSLKSRLTKMEKILKGTD